jgi:hypothetical protein
MLTATTNGITTSSFLKIKLKGTFETRRRTKASRPWRQNSRQEGPGVTTVKMISDRNAIIFILGSSRAIIESNPLYWSI